MTKRMLVSLVALVLVIMGLSLNPNSAWAKSTPLGTHTIGSTSVDPRPAYNREGILALQATAAQYAGRLINLEVRVSALESRPTPPPAPSLKPLKDEIKKLVERLDAVEEDLRSRPTREEFDKLKVVVDGIAVYFDSSSDLYLPQRVSDLEDRVKRLEDEPKAGLIVGLSGLVIGHDAVSDIGVTRVGGGGGFTAGLVIETRELAVQVDGGVDWITAGLGGTHWHGSAVGMARRPGNGYAVGGGLVGQMTLLGVDGDIYYQNWGVGPELRLTRQSWKVAEDRKIFVVISGRLALPMGPVFAEGERLARARPSVEAGLSATVKVGGRGPRRR